MDVDAIVRGKPCLVGRGNGIVEEIAVLIKNSIEGYAIAWEWNLVKRDVVPRIAIG
jgi:hypothetical protein